MHMRKINNVIYINQMPKWPTGCESVTTVMLLKHLGISISVDEFISYLPLNPISAIDGVLFGSSPRESFIGSPYEKTSYGCYSDVIVNTVNHLAVERNLDIIAKDISAMSTEEMINTYVFNGFPVIYWATIDLKPSKIGPSWHISESKLFTWKSNEHCMLLVGEQDDRYIFNDPWNNNGVIAYPKKLVEQRHEEMLSMAVSITPKV